MEKHSKSRAKPKDVNPALTWFGILSVAAEDGNFSAAAAAQQKLAELGWRVGRQRPVVPLRSEGASNDRAQRRRRGRTLCRQGCQAAATAAGRIDLFGARVVLGVERQPAHASTQNAPTAAATQAVETTALVKGSDPRMAGQRDQGTEMKHHLRAQPWLPGLFDVAGGSEAGAETCRASASHILPNRDSGRSVETVKATNAVGTASALEPLPQSQVTSTTSSAECPACGAEALPVWRRNRTIRYQCDADECGLKFDVVQAAGRGETVSVRGSTP